MFEIVDALVVSRVDAERMRSGLVLARGDDLALSKRRRQPPLIGDSSQVGRLVESDPRSVA